MKRNILWDNDGVLVDTAHWYFKATQRALGTWAALGRGNLFEAHGARRIQLGAARASGIDAERIVAKRQQRDAY